MLNVTRVLREGRRGGAREFYIAGDLNVKLGLMCTDEDDIEELNEMYGPSCWQGCENDHGGFKKLMWYWNHEGVQLQGFLHVVQVRQREINRFHAQTTGRINARMEGAAG